MTRMDQRIIHPPRSTPRSTVVDLRYFIIFLIINIQYAYVHVCIFYINILILIYLGINYTEGI